MRELVNWKAIEAKREKQREVDLEQLSLGRVSRSMLDPVQTFEKLVIGDIVILYNKIFIYDIPYVRPEPFVEPKKIGVAVDIYSTMTLKNNRRELLEYVKTHESEKETLKVVDVKELSTGIIEPFSEVNFTI